VIRRLPPLVAALLIAGATACSSLDLDPGVVRFDGGRATLAVDVADEDEERERGLMGVASLPEDGGMAFVYDAPHQGTFWMGNTLIPLSIAFVGPDGRIVTIREMVPCERAPCAQYGADAPYVMAVEANEGWFERNGVEVGDIAELERTDG
jgi:hypothetical protein